MKIYEKKNKTELSKIKFNGFEIIEAGGDGSDLKLLTFRDTDGKILKLTSGSYHEFSAFVEKEKEFVTKFKVKGTIQKLQVECVFDSKSEAEHAIETKGVEDSIIEETQVEKV
jgi:hypothetical protein